MKARTYTNKLPPGKTPDAATAELVMRGTVMNARTAIVYSKNDAQGLDLTECAKAIQAMAAQVQAGDFSALEAMAVAQVVTLNTMFTQLAYQTAHMTIVDQIDRFTRLGLKAQSQCRATLETLAVIKNPPVFARQANIANGPQQVNNPVTVETLPRVRAETGETAPFKLLEESRERVDTGATSQAGKGDQAVEAVEVINRTKKR